MWVGFGQITRGLIVSENSTCVHPKQIKQVQIETCDVVKYLSEGLDVFFSWAHFSFDMIHAASCSPLTGAEQGTKPKATEQRSRKAGRSQGSKRTRQRERKQSRAKEEAREAKQKKQSEEQQRSRAKKQT